MTIRPGQEWGTAVPRPTDLLVADDDAALAATLADHSGRPVTVVRGDLRRTMGLADSAGPASPGPGSSMRRFDVDVVSVTVDDGAPIMSVAHVVAHEPWWRGGWWRGRIVMVMNAQYFGDWDVAARGHPNDGRVEVFEVDETFDLRSRLEGRRRVRSGTHLPHPSITSTSVRHRALQFSHPLVVVVDGYRVGRARTIDIEVLPDALSVHL